MSEMITAENCSEARILRTSLMDSISVRRSGWAGADSYSLAETTLNKLTLKV